MKSGDGIRLAVCFSASIAVFSVSAQVLNKCGRSGYNPELINSSRPIDRPIIPPPPPIMSDNFLDTNLSISRVCVCIGANLKHPDPHVPGIPLEPKDCFVPNPYNQATDNIAKALIKANSVGQCYSRHLESGLKTGHDLESEECFILDKKAAWFKYNKDYDDFNPITEIMLPCDDPMFRPITPLFPPQRQIPD